jgi:ParB/RepB/Spo0J family partition protein
MKGKFAVKRLGELKRRPIRLDSGTEAELIALAESWLKLPIHPIIVRPDGTVADGNRRLDGLVRKGVTEVEVFITDENLTDDKMDEIALLSAVHRKGLSDYERVQAMKRLAAAHSEWSKKRLAEHLDMDPSMVTKMLPTGELIPAAEDAFKARQIGIGDRYNISLLPIGEQEALLARKLSGASRDVLAHEGRQRRNGDRPAPAVRTAKIKCPLPSGQVVTVAGRDLSLEEAIESLGEALKQMKAALAKGLNARTAERVWKDVAAAS